MFSEGLNLFHANDNRDSIEENEDAITHAEKYDPNNRKDYRQGDADEPVNIQRHALFMRSEVEKTLPLVQTLPVPSSSWFHFHQEAIDCDNSAEAKDSSY